MASRRARKAKRGTVSRGRETVFHYRGRTTEDLKAMSLEELLPLLPARARRSLRRGLTPTYQKVLDRIAEGRTVRTHFRDMVVLPQMVDQEVHVHNGKDFVKVVVTAEMIGHYLGEFAPTRSSVEHTGPGVGATRGSKFMPLK